jgi:hypothetical protein
VLNDYSREGGEGGDGLSRLYTLYRWQQGEGFISHQASAIAHLKGQPNMKLSTRFIKGIFIFLL